jgi:hypothetical protein
MSAAASVISPYTYGPGVKVELANGSRVWAKRILPIGQISYKGRTLRFTPEYLQSLADSFHDQAYDQVAFQLADASNAHTNDPERTAGEITDIQLRHDGLYCLAQLTERGERVLSENPRLGVSARIVEQYARSDGKFYPAAIQHVLGTLDPRIPALGPWQPADLSNEDGGMIIDLSAAAFPGDEPPADADELTDEELEELLDGLDDDDLADLDDGEELSDEELAALVDGFTDAELAEMEAEAEADLEGGYADDTAAALTEYANTFSNVYATSQNRELARAEADLAELASPARTSEDILARALSRVGQGTYVSSYGLSNQRLAVELANSSGLCAPPDALGGCSARYHALGCRDHQGDHVELANYDAALEGLSMSLSGPGREDDGIVQIPFGAIELAHALNEGWGLHSGATAYGYDPAAEDLFSTSRQADAYAAMAAELGHPELVAPQPQPGDYPGIGELARELGLK